MLAPTANYLVCDDLGHCGDDCPCCQVPQQRTQTCKFVGQTRLHLLWSKPTQSLFMDRSTIGMPLVRMCSYGYGSKLEMRAASKHIIYRKFERDLQTLRG